MCSSCYMQGTAIHHKFGRLRLFVFIFNFVCLRRFLRFQRRFKLPPPDCVFVCFVCEVTYSCIVILVHYILFCCCFPRGFYALKDASGYPPVDTRDDVQRYPLVSPLPQMTFNATCGGGAPVSARSAGLMPVFIFCFVVIFLGVFMH